MYHDKINITYVISDKDSFLDLVTQLENCGIVIPEKEKWGYDNTCPKNWNRLYFNIKDNKVKISPHLNDVVNCKCDSMVMMNFISKSKYYAKLTLPENIFTDKYLAFDDYTKRYTFVDFPETQDNRLTTTHKKTDIFYIRDKTNLNFEIVLAEK